MKNYSFQTAAEAKKYFATHTDEFQALPENAETGVRLKFVNVVDGYVIVAYYTVDDSNFLIGEEPRFLLVPESFHKVKIRYNTRDGAFFRVYGNVYYMDGFLRPFAVSAD